MHFKLVDMLAQLEQAQLYTYQVAKMADIGMNITRDAALAKMIAADGCNQICQKALNVFGGLRADDGIPCAAFLARLVLPDDRRRHE